MREVTFTNQKTGESKTKQIPSVIADPVLYGGFGAAFAVAFAFLLGAVDDVKYLVKKITKK